MPEVSKDRGYFTRHEILRLSDQSQKIYYKDLEIKGLKSLLREALKMLRKGRRDEATEKIFEEAAEKR